MESESESRQVDLTQAGPMTLMNLGVSFAVDGYGQVLRFPDGNPINGQEIENIVNQSGRRLTNAEAAGRIIAREEFVSSIVGEIQAKKEA